MLHGIDSYRNPMLNFIVLIYSVIDVSRSNMGHLGHHSSSFIYFGPESCTQDGPQQGDIHEGGNGLDSSHTCKD